MPITVNVKLTKKEEVAFGTMAFYFEKPSEFKFKAGQSMDINTAAGSHTFSIAAAPFEQHLMIATRMRDSEYKNALKQMATGSQVSMEGPFGSFVLHGDPSKPAVFLVGGIGITPFFSMIKQATSDKLAHKIFLFYSNRRQQDAAFLRELQNLEKQNPNFKLIATFTDAGDKKRINLDMIKEILPDLSLPIFYSAGPIGMVSAMQELLENASVDLDRIRTEEFSGY